MLIRHAKYLVCTLPPWWASLTRRDEKQGRKKNHILEKAKAVKWWTQNKTENIEREMRNRLNQKQTNSETRHSEKWTNDRTNKKNIYSRETEQLGETTWKIIIQQEARMWSWILLIFAPSLSPFSGSMCVMFFCWAGSTTFNLAKIFLFLSNFCLLATHTQQTRSGKWNELVKVKFTQISLSSSAQCESAP